MRLYIQRTSITHLLVHMHQKKEVAAESEAVLSHPGGAKKASVTPPPCEGHHELEGVGLAL
jgi:hypothetical protein